MSGGEARAVGLVAAEGFHILALGVVAVAPALAIAIDNVKSTIGSESDVGRFELIRLGVFAAGFRIIPRAQHLAVQREFVELVTAMIRKVEDFLAILDSQGEAMSAGIFGTPFAEQLAGLVVDDDVVFRVSGQQENAAVLHLD